tara:strand:- start:1335 stop:3197 length:1863 start_codon:yes stop_codon:yes gene_type:complete
MSKTLIFVENENLPVKYNKNDKIFSFTLQSHNFLDQKKIKHENADNYLDEDDRLKIFDSATSCWNWYDEDIFKNLMTFREINLLKIFDNAEFHQFILKEFAIVLNIKRILEKEQPKKIHVTKHFARIIESMKVQDLEIKIFGDELHEFLVPWNNISIRYKIGNKNISIPMTRTNFNKIKSIFERFVYTFFKLWAKPDNKKAVMFLEFNPGQYSEIFNNLEKNNTKVILVNVRRPAIWNKDSFNVVKKNNCKILNFDRILESKDKVEAKELSIKYIKNLEKIWNEKLFYNKFSIEGISLWNSIKNALLDVYKIRIEDYIKLIIFAEKIFRDFNIKCIVSLNVFGETEKVFLEKNNNKSSILLEHGAPNFVPEISRFDVHRGYEQFQDFIGVWGEIQKEYVINNKKISDKRVLVTGSPRHDDFFKPRVKFIGKKSDKTIVLVPHAPDASNGQSTICTYEKIEDSIKRIIKIVKKYPNVKLIVKLHPTQEQNNEYIKKMIQKIDPSIPLFQLELSQDVLAKCDTMINIYTEVMPSSILTEALIMNIPVLNVVLLDKIHNFEFVKENAVLSTFNDEKLEDNIKKIIFDEKFRTHLNQNGKKYIDRYFSNQGTSSQKFAEYLHKF